MRLYLFPITRTRTLLYCQRLNLATPEQPGLLDRATKRATKLWADWEKKDSGWQKKVVGYGNYAFKRIPYQEWGLKSIPPLSVRRKGEELQEPTKVELVFPSSIIPSHRAEGILQRLGTEREALHRKKLIWCLIGMPISAPFALVPVVPNIPFFYLAYRAWSHWRALSGGKHVQFLLQNKLVSLAPSAILDRIYSTRLLPAGTPANSGPKASQDSEQPSVEKEPPDVEESLLLSTESIKDLARDMELPAVEVEIERAVWQIKKQVADKAKDGSKQG